MRVFRGWEKLGLHLKDGEHVEAIAPVIVSASRRTDIPAFHGEWFFDRLRAGHVKWENPFSGTVQYVSFAKTRVVVFWTKNPKPILPDLAELDRRGLGYYFQFTLNDYEAEGLEPGVPPLAERVETFGELSRRIGKEKVIWRFDPLLVAEGLDVDRLVERVARVGERILPFTDKLVIAFADIDRYVKVRRRLRAFGKGCRELTSEEMRLFGARLTEAVRPRGLTIATCAETIDLAEFGIGHNKCVDDSLLTHLFPEVREIMEFLGPQETRLVLKDKGQRKECGCIVSKDIGTYDTCPHACRYCYATSSDRKVAPRLSHVANNPAVCGFTGGER